MIDQQRPIAPPPSIDEILGNQDRIGRVDFSHRLAPVAVQEPEPAEVDSQDAEAAEARARAAAAPAAPAPAVADLVQVPEESGHPDGHPDDLAEDRAGEPQERDPEDDLEEVDSDELAALEPPRAVVYPADEPYEPYEPEPSPLPRRQPTAQVTTLLSLVPAEDVRTVTDDIDDVVDGVIARIREAQHATLVHLEAIEAEAALRCEMLTAQAELDAELIRLHARREAHAIIAAARQRAGVAQPLQAEDQRRRLDQLGEAAMRLAEELEALGVDPDSPDHPFRR